MEVRSLGVAGSISGLILGQQFMSKGDYMCTFNLRCNLRLLNFVSFTVFIGIQWWKRGNGQKLNMRNSICTWGERSLFWEWQSTETNCPGRLGCLLLWRYSEPTWMLSCVTYCRDPALAGRVDKWFYKANYWSFTEDPYSKVPCCQGCYNLERYPNLNDQWCPSAVNTRTSAV